MDCEGYLTPEGVCLETSQPIGVYPIVDELPNTGDGNIVFLFVGLALVVAGVVLKWRHRVAR